MKRFLAALVAALALAVAHAADRPALRSRAVAPDLQGLHKAVAALRAQAGKPAELEVELFPDTTFQLSFHRVEVLNDGTEALIGKVKGDPYSSAVVVFSRGVVSANLFVNGRLFQVRYRGSGSHEAREVDQRAASMAATDPTPTPASQPKATASTIPAATMTDNGSIIDVMVLYTADARIGASPDDFDSPEAILSQINLAVADTNAAYERSGVTQRLRLVHTAEVVYTETHDMKNLDQPALQNPADGVLDEAHTMRDTFGADVVSLWVENGGGGPEGVGGWSTLMDPVTTAFAPQAFSVVERGRAMDSYAFAHFLGRNMGLRWDAYVDPATTPFPYAHGYVDVTHSFRTIMGLGNECLDAEGPPCPRIPYFSNPGVQYNGFPTSDSTANEALALNNTAVTVANFRQSVLLPGVLSFSPTTYTVNEFGGSVTLSVVRTLDSFGAISVQYSTANGTATAGSDYTATTGTLSWASGESGAKSFAVPISNDGVNEGNETFTVNLSNPTGGASLANSTAQVTIIESSEDLFPRNCTLPAAAAGWTVPSGANAGWVVDTVESTEGRCSLRSGAVADLQKAQIQFAGSFQAGTITFKRKVSSEYLYDCFRFLVDGAQQDVGGSCGEPTPTVGASGELGWQLVTVSIGQGNHTLIWSFERDQSFGGGANAAWIDDVVLPLIPTTTTIGASPNPSAAGQSVTFTATVTRGSGSAKFLGTVVFEADGVAIPGCTAVAVPNVNATSVTATCATASLSGGTHSITAEFSGSGTYGWSVSAPLTQTVNGFALNSVVSRKTHAAAGPLDLVVNSTFPISGAIDVDSRAIGSGHAIVFQFNGPVSNPGSATATDVNGAAIGSVSPPPVASGNEVTVSLTGIPDARRVKVTLTNVNLLGATYTASTGFLLADANASRVVEPGDVNDVKAQSGLVADATTARYDLNRSGAVTASDILMAKGRVGNGI